MNYTVPRNGVTQSWRACAGPKLECPDCGVQGHCVVERARPARFRRNACRKHDLAKAGTVFASSKLPLRLWFEAMSALVPSLNLSVACIQTFVDGR